MKKTAILLFAAVIILMSAFVTRHYLDAGAQGKVNPADGVKEIWAISNNDSVSVVPKAGDFTLELKPGNWKIHVVAVSPFKDAVVENVKVEEGKFTNLGEIKLTGTNP